MIRRPTEDDLEERKGIWRAIRWRMNVHRITPEILARQTPYSRDIIERGIDGEPVPLTDDFIRDVVVALGLTSGRTKHYEETVDVLTYDERVALIKPQPAMPPYQGNFWDH